MNHMFGAKKTLIACIIIILNGEETNPAKHMLMKCEPNLTVCQPSLEVCGWHDNFWVFGQVICLGIIEIVDKSLTVIPYYRWAYTF